MARIVKALERRDAAKYGRYHVDFRPGGHGADPSGYEWREGPNRLLAYETEPKTKDDEGTTFRAIIVGASLMLPDAELCRDAIMQSAVRLEIAGRVCLDTPMDLLYVLARRDMGMSVSQRFAEGDGSDGALEALARIAEALERETEFSKGVLGWYRFARHQLMPPGKKMTMEIETTGRFSHVLQQAERDRPGDWYASIRLFALGLETRQVK